MARQLSFDLPAKTALGREDFFVSPANALAVAMISATSWPGNKLVLSGPAGAGKTHLAHVWAAETGGRIIQASELRYDDVPELARKPIAVEDVPMVAGDLEQQKTLFHLHNLVLAEGHALLMTGRLAPKFWEMPLADLQSRVEGAHHVALDPPDDALLGAVLAKLFVDRQLNPGPEVIAYLVKHMDRRFETAANVVKQLDHLALTEKRDITRALAVRVLNTSPDEIETGD
ncbi:MULTISPECIES: DnaA ATPase domain-containing protein [unclassified Ruegeria]|uniref:DnaA ATPase domain-containing protein n=1 Tax=unclassified Ruegeria TaxID=2625375 RepID=UPI0014895F94|nr:MULTISPECIES: DnaA/Hda family protein [unclassified Ruegeria]NOD61933.1 chromosomal replication initiator DnaA [Ruegeria sp. HKCCD6109]NOD74688.1 chromosomal replication initiator DnaA [Ruegeria sp. HKCCD4332]NOD88578.1 chromosomal replication initiator DnaA [Ruegeria sp. HKCCD4318]NOD92292.1 chromosomal replication initiator DnaA [Ruegeria sp. HKCCD4884]NOE12194.1 chromosomal replication initiator DnaA [Ruegeria sp. HKCCD4318-2]